MSEPSETSAAVPDPWADVKPTRPCEWTGAECDVRNGDYYNAYEVDAARAAERQRHAEEMIGHRRAASAEVAQRRDYEAEAYAEAATQRCRVEAVKAELAVVLRQMDGAQEEIRVLRWQLGDRNREVDELRDAMSKCTKGPWTAVQDDGECWQVLPVMQEDGFAGGYRWVSEADARLIAAAPDLLTALKDIVFEDSDKSDEARVVTRLRARLAVEKAEG